ncbi:MAG: LPS-assembly protein LptD [Verrucomicrobia bacterium]|nr:LPS-assembly protein LptD [Verrucomicrobiota bacterium]
MKLIWHRFSRLSAILLAAFASILVAAQEQERILIEPLRPGPDQQFTHDFATGWSMATNGVVVRYRETTLIADQVELNSQTGEAIATGNVNLQHEQGLWRGERLRYNFKTGELSADTFRVGRAPFFAAGESLTRTQTNGTYTARNAFVTTDDTAEPAYRIRAKRLTIVPGKSIAAEQATVFAGDLPVGYFPFYSRRLELHPNAFVFTPGFRSLYGPYLLGAYRWYWSTNLSGALNLDYRQKRGLGGGPELSYDLGRIGRGSGSYYYTRDDQPGLDPDGLPIRDDRYRIQFSHAASIRTNLTAQVVVNQQSDAQMIRDFFESDYRENLQPKSFLEVNQLWPNFSLNVLAQPQLNDFFQTVERLPDLKLSAFRQQLGLSPLYYEGESSAGYFRFQPAEGSATHDFAAFRADTFHQILLPHAFWGWLNVTPRVGGRFTQYGEAEGEGGAFDQRHRSVFNTGAEVSFKASRVWEGARSKFWDVDGLRHIIQPSVNYVFVPSPSRAPRELPQFDTEIPSLRLLPIDFPDYNSIDSIDSQNVLRLSLRNKIQTKRHGGIDNFANWALYTDWRLDPRPDQTTFVDLFSDLDLKPWSWLTLSSEIRFDVEAAHLNFANHTATIEPNDTWSFSLGHWFFRNDPRFGPDSENNLIRSSIYYKLNENWAARMTHHFEARDGVMEEQYYTLYRDLRSWTAALTFRVRDHRTRETDYTVAVTFSLKAFPRFGLGKDRAKHSLLLGG